ncbi:MAG: FFLEELY motif protein [Caldimonas sp.]
MTDRPHASRDSIVASLEAVAAERRQRTGVAGLEAKVVALKAFQQRRFSRTYADLLASERYGAAARFFLDEMYGPDDYTRRDAQFARLISGLVRLFPEDLVDTVADVAALHALSETLDTAMAKQLAGADVTPVDYVRSWQAVGRADQRRQQIVLTLDLATRLDRFTRKPMLRHALHLMRRPARAAGVLELQQFLETGFDAFRAMKGAGEFIDLVRSREEAFAAALFAADPAEIQRGRVPTGVLAALS